MGQTEILNCGFSVGICQYFSEISKPHNHTDGKFPSQSVPAFLLQLILQLHLTVKLLLQLVDPFLKVLKLQGKKTISSPEKDTNRITHACMCMCETALILT